MVPVSSRGACLGPLHGPSRQRLGSGSDAFPGRNVLIKFVFHRFSIQGGSGKVMGSGEELESELSSSTVGEATAARVASMLQPPLTMASSSVRMRSMSVHFARNVLDGQSLRAFLWHCHCLILYPSLLESGKLAVTPSSVLFCYGGWI